MERKLASIQEISKITPIYVGDEPAQNIEQVWILGYRSIAQKGQFKEGDICVFIEMDGVLDPNQEWVQQYASFMEKDKWRVRMLKFNKMRSQRPNKDEFVPTFSQGLALPFGALLLCLYEGHPLNPELVLGGDVTQYMSITKYKEPAPVNMGDTAGTFPNWMKKTDEFRVQSYPEVLEELRDLPAYATLKIDGSSVTVWADEDFNIHIASRNHERKDGDNIYWNALRPYLANLATCLGDRYCVQGEVYGEGIQRNLLERKGLHFRAFSIYDRKQCRYVDIQEQIAMCDLWDLPHVTILYEWGSFDESLETLETLSKGNYIGTKNPREGIVVRPSVERYSPTLNGRLSFKYINPDYLLRSK